MIPGFLGTNIEGVFKPDQRQALYANWDKLPASVSQVGTYPEEIVSANRETERESGIPFITDVLDDSARDILAGWSPDAGRTRVLDLSRGQG